MSTLKKDIECFLKNNWLKILIGVKLCPEFKLMTTPLTTTAT